MYFDAYQPIRAFTNVGPGNEAFTDFQTNRRYQRIHLKITGNLTDGGAAITDAAQAVDYIAIVINGKERRRFNSLAQLRQVNGINGALYNPEDPLWICIHFREEWLWNWAAADHLSLGFVGLINFRILIKLKDGSTITNSVKIDGFYEADAGYDFVNGAPQGPQPVGAIKQVALERFQVSGDSVKLSTIAWRGQVRRLHLFHPTIAKVRFMNGSNIIHEITREQQAQILKRAGLVTNAAVFVVPFDATQRIQDGIAAEMLRNAEMQVEFDTGTGASFDMIQEFLAEID